MMSHCRVEMEAAQPTAACSGGPGNRWLLLPGTQCQEDDGDAMGGTTGQRARG